MWCHLTAPTGSQTTFAPKGRFALAGWMETKSFVWQSCQKMWPLDSCRGVHLPDKCLHLRSRKPPDSPRGLHKWLSSFLHLLSSRLPCQFSNCPEASWPKQFCPGPRSLGMAGLETHWLLPTRPGSLTASGGSLREMWHWQQKHQSPPCATCSENTSLRNKVFWQNKPGKRSKQTLAQNLLRLPYPWPTTLAC